MSSPATALASMVLPVPGGPYRRTPPPGRRPYCPAIVWFLTGSMRRRLICSFTSSIPATSASVVSGMTDSLAPAEPELSEFEGRFSASHSCMRSSMSPIDDGEVEAIASSASVRVKLGSPRSALRSPLWPLRPAVRQTPLCRSVQGEGRPRQSSMERLLRL